MEREPKHRSILPVRTVRTPKLRNEGFNDVSLSKTKLLVDNSLEGEIERNGILEQQLQEITRETMRLYDEIMHLQERLNERDNEIKRLNKYRSISTMLSFNSMQSYGAQSIETGNTSIPEDPRIRELELENNDKDVELKRLRGLVMLKDEEIEELRGTVQLKEYEIQKVMHLKDQETQKYILVKERELQRVQLTKDQEIVELNEILAERDHEFKANMIANNEKLLELKKVIWQLSLNYKEVYGTSRLVDDVRSLHF